jgi:hypothetical protein
LRAVIVVAVARLADGLISSPSAVAIVTPFAARPRAVAAVILVIDLHLELASSAHKPRTPSGPSARTMTLPSPGVAVEGSALGETRGVCVESGPLVAGEFAVGGGVCPAVQPEAATARATAATARPNRDLDSNIYLSSWFVPVAAEMAATGN